MRRITLFLILTIVSLVSLVAVVAAGYLILTAPSSSSNNPSNWMGQMMGGLGNMMGETGSTTVAQAQNAAAPWFGVAFVALVGVAVVGVGGLVYFFAFPEIINIPAVAQPSMAANAPISATLTPSAKAIQVEATPYDSVLKTLNTNERKVIEVLKTHNSKYLQKYIRSETGLSRLQTHRIVARLAERGIVSLEKTGNTNTVMLATWLK